MEQELKDRLKAERLQGYEKQIFIFQMDVAALEAIGETEKAERCKEAIEQLERSYKAVEAVV